jgi:signal transduction histidine kinase
MTIKARITIAHAAVFGATLIVFAFVVYRSTHDAEVSKLDAFLVTHGQKLETEIEEQHGEHHFPDLRELSALRTGGLTGTRFQLYDSAGAVVIQDSVLPAVPPRAPGLQAQFSTIDVGGREYRLVIMPVEVDDRQRYVLELAAPNAPVQATLRRLQLLFWIAIPITILIASGAAYLITHGALKPIAGMVATANTFSAENLSSRVPLPAGRDEIHLLGRTMNAMMERIRGAFDSQRQFVADASHEIRTPLAVICSELEYAQGKASETEVRESIAVALGEVDRLSRMTDGLLLLSKLDASSLPVKNEPVRLDESVMECIHLLRGISGQRGVSVDIRIDEPAEVAGDADWLKSALLNILDNAIKYSPTGGSVSVSLTKAHGLVIVQVGDSGCGIPDGELPKIFDRFYRASTSRGETAGSGLGLAIVHRVVAMHNGTVAIESGSRKGTTVTVKLPLSGS